MINYYKIIQYFVFLVLLLLLFDFFDLSLFDTYLCDSGSNNDDINDNVNDINTNDDDTTTRDIARLHLLDRVRRRFS